MKFNTDPDALVKALERDPSPAAQDMAAEIELPAWRASATTASLPDRV